MGKKVKEHRKKVAKRNANLKQNEKKMQKLWQDAFEEQMKVMKEKFEAMSGDTMSGLTESLNDEIIQEETTQERSEPTEPIQGE